MQGVVFPIDDIEAGSGFKKKDRCRDLDKVVDSISLTLSIWSRFTSFDILHSFDIFHSYELCT